MVGSYDDEVDLEKRDQFLSKYKLWDEKLSEDDLTERYIKFKDVTFGVAPLDLWPSLFN
jgi:hypothetical protein